MSLTNIERETIVNFNESEKVAEIYTFNLKLQRQLANLAASLSDVKLVNKGSGYVVYEVPKNWIKIRPPRELLTLKHKLLV